MRKVIFQMLVSLDGFFEGPGRDISWHGPVVDEEYNKYAEEFLGTIGTLLFGRVTYELMAGYWPSKGALKDDPIIAKKMNSLQKIVFSRTLQKVDWENSRLAKMSAADEVRKLKKQPGKDMAIFGSSDLCLELIENDLIDEYRIMVAPVVLGEGKRLFQGIEKRLSFKLVKTKIMKTGVVMLHYQKS